LGVWDFTIGRMGSADKNLRRIRDLINDSSQLKKINTHPKKDIKFAPIYNQTRGTEDFLEVYAQKMMERGHSLKDAWILAGKIRYGGVFGIKTSSMQDELQNNRLFLNNMDYLELVYNNLVAEQADVDKVYNILKSDLLAGSKVILVSHSQGGLFATRVNSILSNDQDLSDKPSAFENFKAPMVICRLQLLLEVQ
jgi:hypothetical protein